MIEVVINGARALSINFLTQTPGAIGSGLGGIGPAIEGTLIVVGLASAIGAPVGVLAGIYLSEFAGKGIFPSSVRFFNDVLVGLPSIVIGIVAYVTLVIALGSFSVWAGAFALSIIMIPIVVRVTEETLKIVPNSTREAGQSLGIPKRKIIMNIVLKSAKSGVITGIILSCIEDSWRNSTFNHDNIRNGPVLYEPNRTCRRTTVEDLEVSISAISICP